MRRSFMSPQQQVTATYAKDMKHSGIRTTQPLPPNLDLGIVAHVDAGKTSLTERLLHARRGHRRARQGR